MTDIISFTGSQIERLYEKNPFSTNDPKEHNLFIEIKDGKPINHPMPGWSLRMILPSFDFDNPPEPFAKFTRIPPPILSMKEKIQSITYELVNGTYTDVYHIQQLSGDEILENWLTIHPQPFPSWTLNKNIPEWVPPIPMPIDGLSIWDEFNQRWINRYTLQLNLKGNVQTLTDLPVVSQVDDAFLVESENKNYYWTGTAWTTYPKLRDESVIPAFLEDTPVKILGVVNNINELSVNYSGDYADGYIIDNNDTVYAWNGTSWTEAVLDLTRYI